MTLQLRHGMDFSAVAHQIQMVSDKMVVLKNDKTLLLYDEGETWPATFPEGTVTRGYYQEYCFFDESNNRYVLFDQEKARRFCSLSLDEAPARIQIHEGDKIHTFINYNRDIEVRKSYL